VLPKLLNVVLLVFLLFALGRTLEREEEGPLHRYLPWTLVIIGLNPALLAYSHWILAEIPFTLVSILSIFFFFRFERLKRERDFYLALVLGIAAFYTRLNGISLVAAYVLYFLFTRQLRRFVISMGAAVVLIFPWVLRYVLIRGGEAGGYYPAFTFFLKNIYDPVQGTLTAGDFVGRMWLNLQKYGSWGVGTGILGFRFSTVMVGVGALCSLLIVLGVWKGKHLKNRLIYIYLILYALVLLAWPPAWTDRRFLLPIVPFLFVYLTQGIAFILGRWTKRRPDLAMTLPLGFFGLIYLIQLIGTALPTWDRNLRAMGGDRFATAAPGYEHLFQAALWTRRHVPRGATFLCRKPNLFYLYSGHQAVTYPLVPDPEVLREHLALHDVDHIVHWTSNVRDLQYIGGLAERYPEDLRVIYQTPFPETQIIEYLPNIR
jgi:hypothetical protein